MKSAKIVLAVLVMCAVGAVANAGVIVDQATSADSYCRGGYAGNSNYGSIGTLYAAGDEGIDSSSSYFAMFKFDLSAVEDVVDSAELSLYFLDSCTVYLYAATGGVAWTESTVTYNNYLGAGVAGYDLTSLATASILSNRTSHIDVTSVVQALKDSGNDTIILFTDGVGYSGKKRIRSKESANVPVLDVTSSIPEPATMGLLLMGGIGVLARKRR
jgi:hypothetical protein